MQTWTENNIYSASELFFLRNVVARNNSSDMEIPIYFFFFFFFFLNIYQSCICCKPCLLHFIISPSTGRYYFFNKNIVGKILFMFFFLFYFFWSLRYWEGTMQKSTRKRWKNEVFIRFYGTKMAKGIQKQPVSSAKRRSRVSRLYRRLSAFTWLTDTYSARGREWRDIGN